MSFLIDTNRYSDFVRNVPEVFERFVSAREILVPFIVAAELRGGFLAGVQAKRNEAVFDEFLSNRHVGILFADNGTIRTYASIYAELRKNGTPIPVNDMWIAALAVQHSLPLYTRDQHFDNIPQLSRI